MRQNKVKDETKQVNHPSRLQTIISLPTISPANFPFQFFFNYTHFDFPDNLPL